MVHAVVAGRSTPARAGRGGAHAAAGRRAGPATCSTELDRFHALVVGPGLGPRRGTVAAVRRHVVAGAAVPMVVDGDGLFALAWDADGAAPLLRGAGADGAHAPRRRVRAAGRRAARRRPPRGRSPAGRRHRRRGAAQGPDDGRRRPDGRGARGRRPATPGWPRPAPATCSPGSSARSWPAACPAAGGRRRRVGPRRGRPRRGPRRRPRRRRPRRPPARTCWRRCRDRASRATSDAVAVGVGRGRPRRRRPQRRRSLRRRAPARGVGSGQGQRLRPRGGRRSPGPRFAAGAAGLCVALAQEGVALRRGGRRRRPILVLSEQPAGAGRDDRRPRPEADRVRPRAGSTPLAARSAAPSSPRPPQGRHRMHRVGARPERRSALAAARSTRRAAAAPGRGVHPPRRRRRARRPVHRRASSTRSTRCSPSWRGRRRPPLVHAANSAGALAHPARRGARSCGPASPSTASRPGPASTTWPRRPAPGDGAARPGSSFVKRVAAGDADVVRAAPHVRPPTPTWPRCRSATPTACRGGCHAVGGEVLIGGRRRPIVGSITMDQLMVDCGDDSVAVGDEVVLIGAQGDERITADEWADRLGHDRLRDRLRHHDRRAAASLGDVARRSMRRRPPSDAAIRAPSLDGTHAIAAALAGAGRAGRRHRARRGDGRRQDGVRPGLRRGPRRRPSRSPRRRSPWCTATTPAG